MRNPKPEERSYTALAVLVGIAFLIALTLYMNKLPHEDEVVTSILRGEARELLTVEEIEALYYIEVVMPTPRELQEWCRRRGVQIKIDGIIGTGTINAMDWVRCQQEASKHNYKVEKEFWK